MGIFEKHSQTGRAETTAVESFHLSSKLKIRNDSGDRDFHLRERLGCLRIILAMIHFSLVHIAYQLHHWLPRSTHLRLQVTILFSGLAILFLHFWVLFRPRSAQYCSQPLLCNLVVNIIFAFFTIGLALLLTHVEPGPKALGGLFAVLAVTSFAEGVCTMVLTALASNCEKTTPELYYLSLFLSTGSLVSTVFFVIMGLIWLTNMTSTGLG